MNPGIQQLAASVLAGHSMSRDQAAQLFESIITGALPPDQIESLLLAIAQRGETIDELVAAATVLRTHSIKITCPHPDAIDTCGTGGDGISTFNVSTAAAIVAAAAGAVVAKHGNRSHSRASGSAEVLTALGVNINASIPTIERCLAEIGLAFLFAPALHPAMQTVAAIRKKIAKPTIFNLLGPLTNPAQVKRQIIGVPRRDLLEKMAQVLRELGAERAWIVHGSDGLCDLTITGESYYTELVDGRLEQHTIKPEQFSLSRATLADLKITTPVQSSEAVQNILKGKQGPQRDHTLLNAAAALVIAGIAENLTEGIALAEQAIDAGRAQSTLEELVTLSNTPS